MMEDDSEGPRKDVINSVGPGSNVQGVGAVGVTIWKQELGGDSGNAQGTDGIQPYSGTSDHGDDGEMWGRQRVGVSSGRGGYGISGAQTH